MFINITGADDPSKVGIVMNTDFGVQGLAPAMLQALMAAVQARTLSWNTYFHNLNRGELYPDGRTEEEEAALIEAGPPAGDSVLDQGMEDEDEPGTGGEDEEDEDELTEEGEDEQT